VVDWGIDTKLSLCPSKEDVEGEVVVFPPVHNTHKATVHIGSRREVSVFRGQASLFASTRTLSSSMGENHSGPISLCASTSGRVVLCARTEKGFGISFLLGLGSVAVQATGRALGEVFKHLDSSYSGLHLSAVHLVGFDGRLYSVGMPVPQRRTSAGEPDRRDTPLVNQACIRRLLFRQDCEEYREANSLALFVPFLGCGTSSFPSFGFSRWQRPPSMRRAGIAEL
jgi:hypothetical protein